MKITLKEELIKLYACNSAIEWVGDKTLKEAWLTCEHADWMLWYASYKINRKRLVKITAMCAETVLPIYETEYPTDKRPREYISACYDYANDKITLEELKKYRAAAYAAYVASYAAYAYAAARAARAAYAARAAVAYTAADAVYAAAAAVRAAYAADAASYTATTAAAYAANAAYAAAAAYAADDARSKQHKLMCDIIRKEIKVEELI